MFARTSHLQADKSLERGLRCDLEGLTPAPGELDARRGLETPPTAPVPESRAFAFALHASLLLQLGDARVGERAILIEELALTRAVHKLLADVSCLLPVWRVPRPGSRNVQVRCAGRATKAAAQPPLPVNAHPLRGCGAPGVG